MMIGVPREIKPDEYRVGMLPVGVHLLTEDGHTVLVESGAGEGSAFDDEAYMKAGARIAGSAEEVYGECGLIVKVKEPQPRETARLRRGQILFTYFHFAASRKLTEACLEAGISAVAYETLEDNLGRLPLLTPMSEIAGKLAVQEGARCLENPHGGRGVLLSSIVGVERAKVLVLGGGVVGSAAARVAAAMGAEVTIMDINMNRLRALDEELPVTVTTLFSEPHAVERYVAAADLVVGAALVHGGRAPILIRREMLDTMKKGAVLVDVAIDQGGCFETSRPTTHQDPTYTVGGVVHYCVSNMPGAVSRTSSHALCNATLPYCRDLANDGLEVFVARSPGHAAALNMQEGRITNGAVAAAFPELPAV
jgi:alanine dehydrogenase